MSETHKNNAKLVEICKILGIEATYLNGLYTLRHGQKYLGKMDAASWLDRLRACAVEAGR